jgi:succinate dehydrogenase/fumarate reductase flavoprotein subunit
MTLSVAAILLAVSAAGLALIVVGWRARRAAAASLAAQAAPDLQPEAAPADPVVEATEAISARVAALLQDHERRMTDAFSHVREDLSGLKSDVEWLAGERMIEQAIALAQTGSDAEEIGQELGLSRDQAATIALFRKH